MSEKARGGRRSVVYWAICPECLTYIWVDENQVASEDTADCPYCDRPISLLGGTDLATSCNRLQGLMEDIESQIALIPAAIDVHRFFSEQVDYIAAAFNERLDDIQAKKDLEPLDVEAPQPG
ncbi:MAG: hypothetical protein Q7K29_03115 [Thermoleophilia bacterium]|nr:hypothetical protein [Thermoleophilia bacterium]